MKKRYIIIIISILIPIWLILKIFVFTDTKLMEMEQELDNAINERNERKEKIEMVTENCKQFKREYGIEWIKETIPGCLDYIK